MSIGVRTTATGPAAVAAAVCTWLAAWAAPTVEAQTTDAAPAEPGGTQVTQVIPGRREMLRRSLRFQLLGRARGLPSSQVQAIVQDRTGFMWLGTGDGLARWDGQRFVVFRYDPAASNSLGASFVSELLVAKDGTLWVGTVGGGVNRFLPDKSAFDRFSAKPGQSDALQSASVLAMAEGPDGRIWVGTPNGGLGILDPATGKVRTFSTEDALNATVSAIAAGPDGAMWVGTEAGLFRFDGAKTTFEPVLPGDEELGQATITDLLVDKDGELWVGTDGNGMAHYAPAQKKLTWYRADKGNPERLMDDSIKVIYQDRSGRMWVGGQLVLQLFDPTTGKVERHVVQQQDPRGLPDTPIEMFQDRGGVLWVGTFTGGAALLAPTSFWTYRTAADVGSLSIQGKDLWVTTAEGVCRWRGQRSFEGLCYPIQGVIPVLVDRYGTLWVGALEGGLYRLDANAGDRWTVYNNEPKDESSLGPGSVLRLHEDRAGNLWLALFGGGLQRFDRKKNAFVSYPLETADLQMVKEDPKKDGLLWIGTAGRGLVSLDVASSQMTEYIPNKDDLENKTDNSVTDFLFEGETTVWLATFGGGLKRLDRASGQIKSYRRAQGLPSDNLYAIRRDKAGMLWFSTSDGLVQFNPKTEKPVVFTQADGLQADEYVQTAGEVAEDGRMVFGGLKGFDIFRPEEIQIETQKAPLVVTSIQILGEALETDRPVSTVRSLSLAHDEAFVSIEFAALSYAGSDRFDFEYMVEGASDRWLRSQSGIVSLAGLDDGDYRLLMRARNRHGVQSDPIALSLSVAPPLWRSWYALAAYGAILLGIILGIWRYQKVRIDRLRKLARLATVEREFEVTAAVQSWFLPETAMYSDLGCDLVGFYRGAEKCSGDWWWYEHVSANKLWVIVADVTGHGAGPAMLTAAVAMGIWVQQSGAPNSDEEVVNRLMRVNREVLARCKGKATMTMTACLLDQNTGDVIVYSLGGLPALLIERHGKHTVIGSSGTPLGSVQNLEVGTRTTRMNSGDRLVITTDGIIETTLVGGRPLGFRRFVNVLREVRGIPIGQAVQKIVSDVDVARASQPQEDDFTFCMLERR
jgi:ligand-binding sensor domain-containing protein